MRYRELVETQGGKLTSGAELIRRYGGKVMPFAELPDEAKKALHQWMVQEGDYPEYDQDRYGYVWVPTQDMIAILDAQYRHYEPDHPGSDWSGARAFRPKYPETSVWPLIWGDEWEDGAHRFGRYVSLGLEKVPVVVMMDES